MSFPTTAHNNASGKWCAAIDLEDAFTLFNKQRAPEAVGKDHDLLLSNRTNTLGYYSNNMQMEPVEQEVAGILYM